MPTDPTIITLQQLQDPARYARFEAVPIFRPHVRTRPREDGTLERIEVAAADLPEIVDNMRGKEQADRALLRITDGHIRLGDASESSQPRLLGFANNPRVGTFASEPAILVDQYIRRECLQIARERPFRSAEYYPKTKRITGVALLLRDPQLDLGVVTYHTADNFYFYAMESLMPDITPPTADDSDDYTPDEIMQFERCIRYMSKKGVIQYQAGPGAPSGTNTSLPDDRLAPMQSSTDPVIYQLQQKIARMEQERDEDECRQIVQQLQAEHYALDPVIETRRLLGMAHSDRVAHIQYIRADYSQGPGADSIRLYAGHVEGGTREQETTLEQGNAAVRLASREKISYEAALDRVRNGKAS